MLAYPIPEAEELLKSKLDTAKTSLANCEEDMEFLREQITVASAEPYPLSISDTPADARGRIRSCLQLGRRSAPQRARRS
jgi:hypothetical protein